MPFEEWIYGKPPKDVEFVRINGNRVIRVEIAKMGETPVIFTKDEVEGLMRTDGTPLDGPTRRRHTRRQSGRRAARSRQAGASCAAQPAQARRDRTAAPDQLGIRRPHRRDEAGAVPQAEAGPAAGRES